MIKKMTPDFHRIAISSYFFRRRLKTLTKLFTALIVMCFLFAMYLYGMIEIDSQKVVFKIVPSSFSSHNKNYLKLNAHSESSNKQSSTIEDSSNVNNDFNRHLADSDSKLKFKMLKQVKIYNEKNVTKLFHTIERYSLQITNLLRSYEASNIADTKEKYQRLAKERKLKLKEEFEKLKQKETKITELDKTEDATNDTIASDASYGDLSLIADLAAHDMISREMMIRFLRYENFKQKKKPNKQIRTIKTLLNQYDSNKELDINELPAIWDKYFLKINEYQLYNDTNAVNNILKSMSTSPVVTCHEKEKGTQIKLLLLLADGTDVLVKPMKVARNYETPPDHFYFVDFERHHAEIAAFHVDRLLGFYRVPPTVGRLFNMTTELWQKADAELAKTFFFSPVGNTCFTGHCSYYCDTTHAICGRPQDRMEGSVQLLLPNKPLVQWRITSHPYRRSYNKKKKAEWEINENYCVENVFQDDVYQSKLILDLMDMAVFDFITGNMDRHHYERMISLSNQTFSLHLDNGRSFGKQYHDEMSILAPLKQCCLLRYSTFVRLKYLYNIGFSKLLDESLKIDPLYPILTTDHLKAVDRRLERILLEISKCTEKYLPTQVVVDDGY